MFLVSKGIICTPKLWNKKYRSPCLFKSKTPSHRNAHAYSQRIMGHSQLLSHNLRHIYNVANLIQFINIDTPYAQYRIRSAILRNHLKH